jgi:hypothetical protein
MTYTLDFSATKIIDSKIRGHEVSWDPNNSYRIGECFSENTKEPSGSSETVKTSFHE